jgi:hypothetical protein
MTNKLPYQPPRDNCQNCGTEILWEANSGYCELCLVYFKDEKVQEELGFVKAGLDIVSDFDKNHIWGPDTRSYFIKLANKTRDLVDAIEQQSKQLTKDNQSH